MDTVQTIVYIEDDPEMIDLIALMLNRKGFNVLGALGGKKGLQTVIEIKPALVLLDLMMPDMDGWEVYQQLKNNAETKHIPVIVITAKAQAIDRVLGVHVARVDDYICKPFKPTDLIDSIERVLARAGEKD